MLNYNPIEVAAKLIAVVYLFNSGGGNLHIVLDDYNVENPSLEFCREWIGNNPLQSPPLQLAVETACLLTLEALSEHERLDAIALSRTA